VYKTIKLNKELQAKKRLNQYRLETVFFSEQYYIAE